nr:flavodoxin family protein [uncultured Prevotella sp.]
MKILLINGSPKKEGNTFIALSEVQKTLEAEGVETEMIHVGHKDIHGCIACLKCRETGKCVFHDIVNEVAEKFKEADGIVVGSPVYYASPNGTLLSFLDRLFYSTPFDKSMKVGAAVAVARRGGTTATFDILNKYFTISNMPIVPSQYWNNVHGRMPGEALQDEEGLQTMRQLARNMAFLVKSIQLGKEKYGLPKKEEWTPTHFIR